MREIDDLVESFTDPEQRQLYCREAMIEALKAHDAVTYLYAAHRLITLLLDQDRKPDALDLFSELWSGPYTPPCFLGLTHMKLLLSMGKIDEAQDLLIKMRKGLNKEKRDPGFSRQVGSESLNLLVAEGLLLLKLGRTEDVLHVCRRISRLRLQSGEVGAYIDHVFVLALVLSDHYEAVEIMVRFINRMRKRGVFGHNFLASFRVESYMRDGLLADFGQKADVEIPNE